jgi:hypothetical protein
MTGVEPELLGQALLGVFGVAPTVTPPRLTSNGAGTTTGSPLGVVHHYDTRHYRLPTRKTFVGEHVTR